MVHVSLSELEVSWRAELNPSLSQMSPERNSLWLLYTPAPRALENCCVRRASEAEGPLGQSA